MTAREIIGVRRIDTIRSLEEADLEARREALRSMRWARWRSEIRTVSLLAAVLGGMSSGVPQALSRLLRTLVA
jgi:hypothetical protein